MHEDSSAVVNGKTNYSGRDAYRCYLFDRTNFNDPRNTLNNRPRCPHFDKPVGHWIEWPVVLLGLKGCASLSRFTGRRDRMAVMK